MRRYTSCALGYSSKSLSKDLDARFRVVGVFAGALRDAHDNEIKTSNHDLSLYTPRFPEGDGQKRPVARGDPSSWSDQVEQATLITEPDSGDDDDSRCPLFEVKWPAWSVWVFLSGCRRACGSNGSGGFEDPVETLPEREDEAVSLGKEGEWRSVDDIPELWSVERPPAASDGRAKKVGSGAAFETGDFTGVVVNPPDGTPEALGVFGRDGTFTQLLAGMSRMRKTGMLCVERTGATKALYFRRGNPVAVSSNLTEELLGNYLLHRQVLTQNQLERSGDYQNMVDVWVMRSLPNTCCQLMILFATTEQIQDQSEVFHGMRGVELVSGCQTHNSRCPWEWSSLI